MSNLVLTENEMEAAQNEVMFFNSYVINSDEATACQSCSGSCSATCQDSCNNSCYGRCVGYLD